LLLGGEEVEKLPSTKTFYNLETRQADVLSSPLPLDFGNWMITGMAEEWTVDLPPERGIPKVKGFNGMALGGKVISSSARDEFDYFHFEVTRGGKYNGPDNFEG